MAFARNAAQPLEVDVLLVDEASMIHLEMMAALLDALPPTARLILLGDKDQLASVEAGAVLGELLELSGELLGDLSRRDEDHLARVDSVEPANGAAGLPEPRLVAEHEAAGGSAELDGLELVVEDALVPAIPLE